jgi:hypothetical protein
MSDPQKSDEANDAAAYFRKQLESDPHNWIYKRLVEMADQPQIHRPIIFVKREEIEDEDPKIAGRTGECDVALEVLLELYPTGRPHRLTNDGNNFAHVFLMYKGAPMDMLGMTTIDEMRAHYQDESLRSEPVNLESIRHHFRNHRTDDDDLRYRAHFKKHILANIGNVFPPPESGAA